MGKYQGKSRKANKARQYEPTVVQTRRGPQLLDRPVTSPSAASSCNSSPSKKRAWSPGILHHDEDDHEIPGPSKRSRTSGKVCLPWPLILLTF